MRYFILLAVAWQAYQAHAACSDADFSASVDYFMQEKSEVQHSTGWSVTYRNYYKEVMTGGERYLLVQCFNNDTHMAAAEAALPSCNLGDTTPCKVVRVPVTQVSIAGSNAVLGLLEELDVATTVKHTTRPVTSACLQAQGVTTTDLTDTAQMAAVNIAFTEASARPAKAADDEKIVKIDSLVAEESPMSRAEWAEFVSLFYNKEGLANYVTSRTRQMYDEQVHIARSLPAVKIAWIEKVDGNLFTFSSSKLVKSLAESLNAIPIYFGETVDIGNQDKRNAYIAQMKQASAVFITNGVRYSKVADVFALLQIAGEHTQYTFYSNTLPSAIYQVDRYVGGAFNDHDNLWGEEVSAAPDLFLSDMIKATHRSALPWKNAEWMFLRYVTDSPSLITADAAQCGRGLQRPTPVIRLRHALMAGMNRAAQNPEGSVSNFDVHTDYFPDKGTQEHAQDFEIFYHLTWKLVRNYKAGEDYILLQRGTPGSAHPAANVLPNAKRIFIPVRSSAVQATPSVHIETLLGKGNLIKMSTWSPHHCMLKGFNDGTIKELGWDISKEDFSGQDVFFANGKKALPNSVAATVTSDPGPLHRAEWVNFHGAFHNKEKLAESIFAAAKSRYLCVTEKGAQVSRSAGRRPTVMSVSYSSFSSPPYFQVSKSAYLMQMISDAGGVSVSVLNTSKAFAIGTHTTSYGNPILKVAPADIKAALEDVDVLIDTTYHSSANSVNRVGIAKVNEVYGFVDADIDSLAFLKNKRVYRFDKGVEDDKGFTDQFTRAVVEPDAVIEDYINAIHPGWDVASRDRGSHFLRNVYNTTESMRPYSASQCTGVDSAEPLADALVCMVPCADRQSQQYCNLECVWDIASSTCSEVTPVPIIISTPAPTEGGSQVMPGASLVAVAALALLALL